MNPKIKEKKHYFSPSQINSFIDRRDQYIRNYVLGQKFVGNASFARGKAIEHGLDKAIQGMSDTQACDEAWRLFLEEIAPLSEREKGKFNQDHITAMTMAAIMFYKTELGAAPSVESQVKIELRLDGVNLPIIGYCDFVFPPPRVGFGVDKGVRDLKTAAKSPSKNQQGEYKLSDSYARQGTVYHLATGRPVTFDYVVATKTPKVVPVNLTQDEIAQQTPIILAAINAMTIVRECIPDPAEASEEHIEVFKALAFPALDSVWNPDERRDLINEFTSQFR